MIFDFKITVFALQHRAGSREKLLSRHAFGNYISPFVIPSSCIIQKYFANVYLKISQRFANKMVGMDFRHSFKEGPHSQPGGVGSWIG